MSTSKRVSLERSRELSENVSFGVGTLFVAEKLGVENRFRGFLMLCHLRYALSWHLLFFSSMTCFLFFRFFVVYALSWHWHCSFSSNFETIVICNSSVGTKGKEKRDDRETACRSLFSRHKNVQICKYSANIDARAESTAISGDGVVSFTQ